MFQVTPSPTVASLNPDADVFQSKVKPGSDASGSSSGWETLETDVSLLDGNTLFNLILINFFIYGLYIHEVPIHSGLQEKFYNK